MTKSLLTKIDITGRDIILTVNNQPVLEIGQVNDDQTINLFLYALGRRCFLQCESESGADAEIIAERTLQG